MSSTLSKDRVWKILEEVKDPEIPIISVVELGIIRQVEVREEKIQITITPTFLGCPAIKMMQQEMKERLLQVGAKDVQVSVSNKPLWSSDEITPEGRKKLKNFGLAPPPQHQGQFEITLQEPAVCPYCESRNTSLKNPFGPTLCRAIYICNDCRQPFEQFKPI